MCFSPAIIPNEHFRKCFDKKGNGHVYEYWYSGCLIFQEPPSNLFFVVVPNDLPFISSYGFSFLLFLVALADFIKSNFTRIFYIYIYYCKGKFYLIWRWISAALHGCMGKNPFSSTAELYTVFLRQQSIRKQSSLRNVWKNWTYS